jgi:S1-C subfamily serine protease
MMTAAKRSLLITLCLFTVGAARVEGQPHCKVAAQQCADQIRQILKSKRYLGVTLGETRWGTVVRSVTPGSPAAAAGLLPGDRIIGINNEDATGADPQQVKQLLMPGGNPAQLDVTIVVVRIGKYHRIRARLGLMPDDKIDKIVEKHLQQAHREDED